MKGTIHTEKENWSLGMSKGKLMSSEIFKFSVESFANDLFLAEFVAHWSPLNPGTIPLFMKKLFFSSTVLLMLVSTAKKFSFCWLVRKRIPLFIMFS